MGSGVSYTNEERDGEEVLSGVQEAATDSPSSLHPSVSKRRQQIKCRRVSSVGCRSTQDTSSEGESFSMGAARRRVPPPHRQEMPWHGACSYRPALPMGAKRTPRKLKDHRKDHEKNIKGNTRPIFLLPRIWGSMATYRCISNTGKKGWGTQTLSSPPTVSARELLAHHVVGIQGRQGRGSLLGHTILIINPTPFPILREQYVESPLV